MRLYTAKEASEKFSNVGAGPTIFIECTETFVSKRNTGIQRVVRNIAKHAGRVGAEQGIDVITVTLVDNKLVYVDLTSTEEEPDEIEIVATGPVSPKKRLWRSFQKAACKIIPSRRFEHFVYARPGAIGLATLISNPIRFASLVRKHFTTTYNLPTLNDIDDLSNCVLLLLDADWHLPVKKPIRDFKKRGGAVVSVSYDLIPIILPHTCEPALVGSFTDWTNFILSECSNFIAISKSTAESLTKFARGAGYFLPPVSHFYLGSELDLDDGQPASPNIKTLLERTSPAFLTVGSIEPRKNHEYALDAFELYWERGGAGSLIIIGKYGWKNLETISRICNHKEFGNRLFLLRDASDADLNYAYKTASALIFPSIAEGFGLPIVEAFQRGLPVLCSDIPVFREVAEGHATFFDLADPSDLASALLTFQKPATSSSRWITWEESARQLINAISDQAWKAKRTYTHQISQR